MTLPVNVKNKLQSSSHSIHQNVMLQSRQNITSAGNIVRHSAAKQVDEVSPEAARSIDKILALPK